MKKTIVFLDFDGVIATRKSYLLAKSKDPLFNDNPFSVIDIDLLNNVKFLCKEVNAEIVLSTYWRTLFSVNKITSTFQSLNFDIPIIGKTPIWPFNRTLKMSEDPPFNARGLEIAKWLEQEIPCRYVILDDACVEPLEHRAVKTYFDSSQFPCGFTEIHIEQAINLLREQK